MTIQQLRNKLEQKKGQKFQLEQTITSIKKQIRENKRNLHKYEEAREIIKTVGNLTQDQLKFHISDITSMALEAVFPEPYNLNVEFIQKHNQTECELYFERDNNKVDPLEASGIGAVDVASFALRIASWSMQSPRSRNIIILDEPFKYLSEEYQPLASQMIKEVSQKLGIQFIMITHNPIFATHSDRLFETKIRKGITRITQIN